MKRVLLGAMVAALLVAAPRLAEGATRGVAISDRSNLVTTGGFEADVSPWEPIEGARVSRVGAGAKFGSGALRVVVTRTGGGAFSLIPTPNLLEAELVGPVTGILQGRFRVSVWARGTGLSVGKRLRFQVNEYGGARDDRVIAAATIRLERRWKRVTARGMVTDDDGSGVSALAVLRDADPGDVFFIDEFRVAGTPRARLEPAASSERWAWWNYVLVWAAAAAAALAWVAYARRSRGKTGLARIG